ncbi:MAG: hypothetical protein ABIJ96_16350 [Elusimicrobiota bacterium]
MKARTLVLTFAAAAFTVSSAWAALPQLDLSEINAGAVVESLHKGAKEMPAAKGAEAYDPLYWEIDPASVVHEELDAAYLPLSEVTIPIVKPGDGKPGAGPDGNTAPTPGGSSDSGLDDVNEIINIAEKIWKFIERNKPVVNVTTHYANAVPAGTEHWTELEGWSKPERTLYSFSAKNGYGKKVVDVTYIVLRTAGGKKAGKGLYLTGVTVIPVKVDVLWGFKYDMGVEVASVSNVGTTEEPVAGMIMNLTWQIANNRKVTRGAGVYYLQGDGHFEQMASPFKD